MPKTIWSLDLAGSWAELLPEMELEAPMFFLTSLLESLQITLVDIAADKSMVNG